MSVLKTNADDEQEDTKEAADGGPGVIEASRAFNNDGPTLVDEVSVGGNCVRHAEPTEKLVDHCVNIASGWCGANSFGFRDFIGIIFQFPRI